MGNVIFTTVMSCAKTNAKLWCGLGTNFTVSHSSRHNESSVRLLNSYCSEMLQLVQRRKSFIEEMSCHHSRQQYSESNELHKAFIRVSAAKPHASRVRLVHARSVSCLPPASGRSHAKPHGQSKNFSLIKFGSVQAFGA